MIENLGSTPEGINPGVTVYTRSGCETCQALKTFLSERGVPFEEKDIVQDSIAADELATLTQGAATAPVVVIGEKVVVGFDRPEITRELGIN
jgi:glutaredoxin